jgi:hypothetical protein
MRRSVLLLLVALLGPAVVAAQRVSLRSGARVRVTPADQNAPYLMGMVIGQTADSISILIGPGDTVRVSLASLELLEVSRGRRAHRAEGAGWGLVIGAAAGAGIGVATTEGEWRGLGALVGAGGGALAGLLVGIVVGDAVRSERWEAAPGWKLNMSLSPAGAGLRMSIPF